MAMEDFTSFFFYQESVDELKQKVIYMAYELQSARMQATEEARKNKENTDNIKHLLHLLHAAYKERDEAKEVLRKTTTHCAAFPVPIPSPERRTSSGLTDSASQGDSLYDVISPVMAGTAIATTPAIDPETRAIFDLAKGKTLPEKGRLLEAVMEAGPLLQTLMVAGSLPQWRNPPPTQPSQVPPVGISVLYGKKACGGSLDFSGGGGGFAVSSVGQMNQMMVPTPKRQRIQ